MGTMGKIVLFKESIIADNLTYEQANILAIRANESPAAQLISFCISRNSGDSHWKLLGRSRALTEEFLRNTEDFVIDGD
jgi:hypothetical protein